MKSEKLKSILKGVWAFFLFCVLVAEKGEGLKQYYSGSKEYVVTSQFIQRDTPEEG